MLYHLSQPVNTAKSTITAILNIQIGNTLYNWLKIFAFTENSSDFGRLEGAKASWITRKQEYKKTVSGCNKKAPKRGFTIIKTH